MGAGSLLSFEFPLGVVGLTAGGSTGGGSDRCTCWPSMSMGVNSCIHTTQYTVKS